jgi:hypothetical protein
MKVIMVKDMEEYRRTFEGDPMCELDKLYVKDDANGEYGNYTGDPRQALDVSECSESELKEFLTQGIIQEVVVDLKDPPLDKLRDAIVVAHGMSSGSYVQSDTEMLNRINTFLSKVIQEDEKMSKFLQ